MLSELTPDTLHDCVELYVKTFNAPPWSESWTAADAHQRLTDLLYTPRSHGVCSVACDGQLVGFALGHLERVGAEDHFLLQEMCVRGSQQRDGHGTRLLAALADRLRGVEHWFLLTARDSAASAFYEKNGFRPAERLAAYVRP